MDLFSFKTISYGSQQNPQIAKIRVIEAFCKEQIKQALILGTNCK